MENYQIEITRNNITLAGFLAQCKFECKQKGIDFDIELKEFKNPTRINDTSYLFPKNSNTTKNYNNGKETNFHYTKENAPCESEICRIKSLDYQTYILNHDNSMYNEICEFTFYDDKIGYGYYYQINKA